MPLDNFGVVIPGRLFRCAQPDVNGCASLAALRVDLIVRLNGNEADPGWTGLCFCRDAGTFSGFQQDLGAAVDAIQRGLSIARVIAVHCTHGRDRTGAVVAAYRIRYQGWSFAQADEERLQYGSALIQEVVDHEIAEWLRSLTPSG